MAHRVHPDPQLGAAQPPSSTTSEDTKDMIAKSLNDDDDSVSRPPSAGKDLEEKHVPIPPNHPSAFPDGGLQAWSCTFGAFCCLFCSFGWINCIGVFQGYYEQNQLKNYSPSTVSWISSLEVFFMFIGGAIVGKFLDAYGPRYVLLIGSFLHVFGLMMASISHEYWHFLLAQGICSSIGACMVFYPAMTCVSTWFFKRRALALGIMTSGSSLGGVIFPIMIRRLIIEVGFGWSMRITAFLILALLIIANLTLRSRLPPRGPTPWALEEFIRPFADVPFVLIVVAGIFYFFGMFLPFNYLPLFGIRKGMSQNMASYLISILNAASVFGRILPGYIADKVGRFNTLVVITYASAVLVFALWIPTNSNAPTIVFAAAYGFATGGFVSLCPALIGQISDIHEIGLKTGVTFAAVSFAALAGNPVGGALITRYNGGYLGLQIFTGVMLAAGSTVFLLARVKLAGWSINKKV